MRASAKVLVSNPPAKKLSKEEIEDYIDRASKLWKRYSSGSLVAAMAMYEDGTVFHCGQVCFHSIRDPSTKGLATICAWIMPHACGYTSKLTAEEGIAFLDYLANESPYQDAFLCKDAEYMWEKKTMAFDVSCEGNIMVGGMIAARSVYYSLGLVKTFLALVEGGMNKDLALFIVTGTSFKATSDKIGFSIKACQPGGYAGHAHLNTNSFDIQSLWNFLDHDPKFVTPPFRENNKYYGLHVTFLGNRYRDTKELPFDNYSQSVEQSGRFISDKDDRAVDYLSKLYKSGGVSTTSIHNIFSSVKVYVSEADIGFEALDIAVPKLIAAGVQVMKDFHAYKESNK